MLNFLFGFSGRIRRRSYAFGMLGAQAAIVAVAVAIIEASGVEFFVFDPRRPNEDILSPFVSQVFAGAVILMAWIATALFFKRMHDFSETNLHKFRYLKWLFFVAVIPCFLLNLLSLLALGQMFQGLLGVLANSILFIPVFIGPEHGPNRFGPDPRDPTAQPGDGHAAGSAAAATPPNAVRMQEMARSGSPSALGARPMSVKVVFGKR